MATKPIKLGLMPPLTGLVGIYGTEIVRAAQIACDEINEQGGLLGRPLELVIEDDGSLPESAVAAAEKLVKKHHCTAIIGNLLSNSRIAVAYQVAEPNKIPYLNFSFYEGSISSRYFMHFAALPNQQIDRMIPYMREKFGPRMFFAGNNYEWPRGSVDAAKRALLRDGGEIVGEMYCPIGATNADIEALLDRLEEAAPDVFVPYFAGADQVNLLTRFTERGLKKKMAVVMGHYDEMMASKLSPEVREGFYSSNTYFMTIDSDANRDYLSRLANMPGVSGIWPNGNGILTNFGEGAYICVKAFAKAVEAAGGLDAESLIDSLKTISVSGPQGEVHMDPASHHAKVNTYLSRCLKDGSFEIVESFGSIEPVLPERYNHQRIDHQAVMEEDIRLQARILEQMSDGVLLIDARDHMIVYANSGAKQMFAMNGDNFIGMPYSKLTHGANDGQDGSIFEANLLSSVSQNGSWQGDIRLSRLDGTDLWCSVSLNIFTHPVLGEVWLAVHRDITSLIELQHRLEHQRGQLEQEARERSAAEERLRLVIQATDDGVWDWDIPTGDEYLSPRWKAIIGYRDDELTNTVSTFFDLIHPDDVDEVTQALRLHFEEYAPYMVEMRLRHKDGSYRWVLSRGEALRDEANRATRMVGAITDITDRKLAEAELRAHREHLEELVHNRTVELEKARDEAVLASQAKTEFLSRMSHELRTPMNAIIGFSQLLGLEPLTADQIDSVDEIRRAGDHLLNLIDDLLDLSRIESGKIAVVMEPLSLRDIVVETTQIVHAMADNKQVSIINNCQNGISVISDSTRLRQILVNLISNAIKYNNTGGRVLIDCSPQGTEHIRIAVTDTGPGIPPEKLPRLFKPFDRLGAEIRGIDGVGIGLALSQQLATMMGSAIEVSSTLGEGSSFWLDVKLSATTRTNNQESVMQPNDSELATVLYVEDNASNLKLVATMFKHMPDLRLISATNGEFGLELARRYRPDVILLDIHLPGMDGYQVLSELQDDPATSDIPVLALSADAMPIDIEQGLKAGFREYLTKPIDINDLQGALTRALTDKRATVSS